MCECDGRESRVGDPEFIDAGFEDAVKPRNGIGFSWCLFVTVSRAKSDVEFLVMALVELGMERVKFPMSPHSAFDKHLDHVAQRKVLYPVGPLARIFEAAIGLLAKHLFEDLFLVREVLIQRPDAHAGACGDVVGRERLGAALLQDVASSDANAVDELSLIHI